MGKRLHWELVIFDCDGVLVDSEELSARVFAAVVGELGLQLSSEEVDNRFRGRSLGDCQRIVEQMLGRALGDDFLEGLNRQTYEAFRRELRPVAGVSSVLQQLRRRGVQTCVASSGSHEKMRLTLSLTDLLPLLDGRLFSALDVPKGKPAPDLFEHAARSLSVDAVNCVVIEDSLVGARGALAAKMSVYGFVDRDGPGGQVERQRAFDEWGVKTFTSMTDLPALLGL